MLKNRIALLCLALLSWGAPCGLLAESRTLSIRVLDTNTGEPIAGAVVIVNDGAAAEPVSAVMAQENRQFQPKVLVVPKGSEVNFPNKDATQHHVYSFSPARVFNIELFADQPEAPILFDKSGVVEVGCNIHDQMQGFILVTDSGLTARTDSTGTTQLVLSEKLANRTDISLSLWHPRLEDVTAMVDASVAPPGDGPVKLSLDLTPEPEKTGRLDGLQKRFRDL